nr:asparagine synthetase domain-containing protein c4f6.11c [Quercus suber]
MCGIFCALSTHHPIWPSSGHEQLLHNRGPDSQGRTYRQFAASPDDVHVTCFSTVLSLRGATTVAQPHCKDENGPSLCWNGEAWSIGSMPTHYNDTEEIYRLLVQAIGHEDDGESAKFSSANSADTIAQRLSSVAGPYAFVFYDPSGIVYFGRDSLGRRSLLTQFTDDGDLLVASVSDGVATSEWSEIEADGLYYVDLNHVEPSAKEACAEPSRNFVINKVPYHFMGEGGQAFPSVSDQPIEALNECSDSVLNLQLLLVNSIGHRVRRIQDPPSRGEDTGPPLAKLGILFSGGLDCTVLARLAHDMLPITQPIDLINVAFENPRVHKTANTSGAGRDDVYELCPDRITGRTTYGELKQVCPDRDWRFVAINVPYAETLVNRPKIITLMQPHNTEMDLSICLALYFAARGIGYLNRGSRIAQPYVSSARVLLSGLGADELFAGYTRHATAFKRSGPSGLLDELDLDIGRLGKRNLGRDDRVISDSSREVRFPFLDEVVIAWALALPVHEKCDFQCIHLDRSACDSSALEPGKKILRCVAWKLGMKNVAKEKKRAVSACIPKPVVNEQLISL